MAVEDSAWSPLRYGMFRALLIASFASNVGTLMQSVGASWLMTSLEPGMLYPALVQSATALPTVLLALPAGALADLLDRRKLILATQGWMMAFSLVLGCLTVGGWMSPWLLLGLTFAIGLGAALNAPAWQAIVPELVPRQALPSAVALNSAGFNAARAIGPALGGLVVASFGAAATFFVNAATYVAVLVVVWRWERPAAPEGLPREGLGEAMRAGAQYVRHSRAMGAILTRAAAFILPASAIWALLPLIARYELKLGAFGYGGLLGCLGAGAVLGAILLPRFRRYVTVDQQVALASLAYALATAVPAVTRQLPLIGLALVGAGVAWLGALASFNTAVQASVPAWVRGRALAIYLLVIFAGLSIGSAGWGWLANHSGLPFSLLAAAALGLFGLLATAWLPLPARLDQDLAPSMHWPDPEAVHVPEPEEGPVYVTVEYLIAPEEEAAFLLAMRDVRRIKLREGARHWSLIRDLADPGRFLESFTVRSWLEHMRQHERVTGEDQAVEARAKAFHRGEVPPVVLHYIGTRLPRETSLKRR